MDKQRTQTRSSIATQGYIVLVFIVMFLYGISRQALGTLITPIIDYYGIRMAEAGLLSSYFSVGNFVALFVVTVFSGRINKIILAGASLFLFTASLFLISAAPQFSILLICFAFMGVFATTVDTLTNSLVADLAPDKIGRNISLLHGLFGLGGLSGPIAIERLSGRLSWSQAYFAISLIYFTCFALYAVFVRWQWNSLAASVSYKDQARFGFRDIVQFFARKRHVLLWVTIFFYSGNQNIMAVWIKRYVETHLNVPVWGAYALSAMWMGTAVSRLFISPNVKAPSVQKIFFGNAIAVIVLTSVLFSGSASVLAAAALVVGLSSGFTVPVVIAMSCEWHPEKTSLGTVMPYMAISIASVVFPPLSGLISDLLGIPWGFALGAVCAFLAVVFSGALWRSGEG